MPFKINISHKGKTTQIETESEVVVGKKIGETIKGEDISKELDGYELEITGASDISGIPGFKGLEGAGYHRKLLTYGFGMKNRKKGFRKRKTLRGEEISLKTIQINTKVIKEGNKKFETLIPKKEKKEESGEAETSTEQPTEKPAKQPKEEKIEKETKKEVKEEKKKEEKPTEERKN